MLPTLRSLPAPEALATYLGKRYGIPFTGCTLLRSLVNDVYLVAAKDARYVLKLYRYGGRQPDEVRWETGLSAHLVAHGLLTPAVHPLPDGDPAGSLDAPEGPRAFVLQEFLDGAKPPYEEGLYREFGGLVARFHEIADSYVPEFPRRGTNLPYSLDELRPHLAPAEENLLRSLDAAVRNNLAQYHLTRGICHGDVSLDNLLVSNTGLTLYDFDLAGPGYLAADFTGVATTPYWNAFKTGYTSRRTISADDEAAIPYLRVVARLSNLGFHLLDKPTFRGTESRGEGWAEREFTALREAADEIL
ncbi:Ser/Thr protein kinase RdoA (MazF antagonist) [Kribbella antiqua]|uniref:Ser/Thr protein kinase RdoA (MazF antagonist) n=1 Tax=Kribbella antiqua TaxID=2512217 RepID=A0A4R2IVQ0_9ACTN|nr:phosphotransferase [Kribbella antiqua]TCO49287.1 Ser/Thr protein kinase RdoA (MazF antagonist) [Kribbella antiqua]